MFHMFDNGAGPKPRQDRYQLPSLTSSNMKPITGEAERERVNSNSLCKRLQLTCGITNPYLRIICIYNYTYIVTCTAFPYVTLHSQPFPITRLVAVLCYTCYFVPPNGLGALPICLCSCDAP